MSDEPETTSGAAPDDHGGVSDDRGGLPDDRRGLPDDRGDAPDDRGDALRDAVDAIGDRWKLLIVAALLDGPRRFGDLERELEGIAPNVLSARLRALEADGLVVARPYCERPPRYAYELTEAARGLGAALDLLAHWAASGRGAEAPVHHQCGSPLEAGWFCPTCERPVTEADAEELDFA